MDEKQLKLNIALMAMIGSEELVLKWWDSANYNWSLKTPQEVWDSGKSGQIEVINYVLGHLQK